MIIVGRPGDSQSFSFQGERVYESLDDRTKVLARHEGALVIAF